MITDDQIEELGTSYFYESVTVSSWDERDNILEEGCNDNPGLLLVLQVDLPSKVFTNKKKSFDILFLILSKNRVQFIYHKKIQTHRRRKKFRRFYLEAFCVSCK